jgi:hypothetical protein
VCRSASASGYGSKEKREGSMHGGRDRRDGGGLDEEDIG